MLRNTWFAGSQADGQTITFRDAETTEAADSAMDMADVSELPLDLVRSGNKLIVRAPIAGGGLHDINVTVTSTQLTIHKSSWHNPPEEREHFYVQECHWGSLSRTVDLPKPIDPDRTRATLSDGVLTVVMPLASASHSKIIPIKGDGA